MGGKRITEGELDKLVKRKGFGISSSIGKGASRIKSGSAGTEHDLEPNPPNELEGSESVQVRCAGKIRVRIKFYRRRLADYSRAISEKALIDCLQYSGLISGDSEKEIWLQDEGQEKVKDESEERTEIVIEYPEVDFDNLWEPRKRKDGR